MDRIRSCRALLVAPLSLLALTFAIACGNEEVPGAADGPAVASVGQAAFGVTGELSTDCSSVLATFVDLRVTLSAPAPFNLFPEVQLLDAMRTLEIRDKLSEGETTRTWRTAVPSRERGMNLVLRKHSGSTVLTFPIRCDETSIGY